MKLIARLPSMIIVNSLTNSPPANRWAKPVRQQHHEVTS
jgi:hypothetical protein